MRVSQTLVPVAAAAAAAVGGERKKGRFGGWQSLPALPGVFKPVADKRLQDVPLLTHHGLDLNCMKRLPVNAAARVCAAYPQVLGISR